MVVDDAYQQPSLSCDGRPAVGIPFELRQLGVLSPVVLHGHSVLGIGEIQASQEAPVFVAEVDVQLGLGQTRSHDDETHRRLPG